LVVTGGIAAYKSAELVRRLKDLHAEVRVAMTDAARQFITPLTFQALTGHPVSDQLFNNLNDGMEHIHLARWADAMLIAPCSANFMAKIALGLADDLASTLCLASATPIAIAPAMNQQMWQNPATQTHLSTLRQRDILILGPAQGEQACGEHGPGRMLDVTDLIEQFTDSFVTPSLAGLNVLITAGPTHEAIDPVRFIGNRSSGKMGFALAQAAQLAGAKVTLVSGPVNLDTPPQVQRINVVSACDMHQKVFENLSQVDIFIANAAVADYRPKVSTTEKLKKNTTELTLTLTPNPDILSDVAKHTPRPFCVGFAAETQNMEQYAKQKRQQKQIDLIAANLVGPKAPDSGFESDENALDVFWKEGSMSLPKTKKSQLAHQLIQFIADKYHEKNTT